MKRERIVGGQRANADKAEQARQLRQKQTPEEVLLWQKLKGNRLGGCHFRRQQVIDGYIADFYCHAAGLVIEIDGAVHKKRCREDAYRDEVLRSHELTVLRVSNDEVRADIEAVLQLILVAIGTPLPVSGRGRGQAK